MNNGPKIFWIVIALLILGVIGFYVGKKYLPSAPQPVPAPAATSSQTLGGQIKAAVPAPTAQIPQTNPYKAANPYSNVKTNPFAK